MDVKKCATLWPVLTPIAVGVLLIGALVIVNGTRSRAPLHMLAGREVNHGR